MHGDGKVAAGRESEEETSSAGQLTNGIRLIRQHRLPSTIMLKARPEPQRQAQSDNRILFSHPLLALKCLPHHAQDCLFSNRHLLAPVRQRQFFAEAGTRLTPYYSYL